MKKKITTGDKTVDKLYEAVRDYIETRKGKVVVIGVIALINEGTAKFNYGLMIRITGKRPNFKKNESI